MRLLSALVLALGAALAGWFVGDGFRLGRQDERYVSVKGIAEREVKAEKPVRTHWDMLLERRSEKELEDILKERLELLRGGEIGPAHLHRVNAKKRKASA